jgi:hypothetical protein
VPPLLTLDEALFALLHRRAYRAAFIRGDTGALHLGAADLEDLSTIDATQIERSARRLAQSLFRRSHRGTGTLLDAFPATIDAWQRDHLGALLDELAFEVFESPHFERYRALPFGPEGLSLEEVFFLFAEDARLGDADTRKEEFVHAIVKALAVTPAPSFRVPDSLRRAPQGFFAVLPRGPRLVAAVSGRLITGEITPFLAALLTSSEPRGIIADRFGVGDADLSASLAELGRLGLAPQER